MYYRGCWHIVSRGFLVRYRQLKAISYSQCSSLTTEVYDPKTFILHAAWLRQTFVHCEKFPTAATRRCLDRVSVPMWPISLSARLCIVALVSLYLTNQLMHRGSIHQRSKRSFEYLAMRLSIVCGISYRFQQLSPTDGQVTHVLLTRSPLTTNSNSNPCKHFKFMGQFVRLACIRHAASVHPEPGSNSQYLLVCLSHYCFCFVQSQKEIDRFHIYLVFKVLHATKTISNIQYCITFIIKCQVFFEKVQVYKIKKT